MMKEQMRNKVNDIYQPGKRLQRHFYDFGILANHIERNYAQMEENREEW